MEFLSFVWGCMSVCVCLCVCISVCIKEMFHYLLDLFHAKGITSLSVHYKKKELACVMDIY